MYVCLCKSVTDRQIRETINGGACTYAEVRRELGVSTQCGKCWPVAKAIIQESTGARKASFEPAA